MTQKPAIWHYLPPANLSESWSAYSDVIEVPTPNKRPSCNGHQQPVALPTTTQHDHQPFHHQPQPAAKGSPVPFMPPTPQQEAQQAVRANSADCNSSPGLCNDCLLISNPFHPSYQLDSRVVQVRIQSLSSTASLSIHPCLAGCSQACTAAQQTSSRPTAASVSCSLTGHLPTSVGLILGSVTFCGHSSQGTSLPIGWPVVVCLIAA